MSQSNPFSRVWWYRLFLYFEENVNGMVPRNYQVPSSLRALPWNRGVKYSKLDIQWPLLCRSGKGLWLPKVLFFPWKTALFSVARCPFTSSNRHIPVQMGSTVTHLVFFFSVCKHIIFLSFLVLFLLCYSCQHRALIYICFGVFSSSWATWQFLLL